MRAGADEPRPGRDDDALIERARQGDGDSYGELVIRYQGIAVRTALLITRDEREAEEAAQDAFVKAFRALARFRTGAPFKPWLLRIVANESINRRTAAQRRPTVDIAQAFELGSDDAASPETAALTAERRDLVLAALEKLREDDRLVVTYRYLLDLTESEMAEALGVARGTVKSRLSRAMSRLREVMS